MKKWFCCLWIFLAGFLSLLSPLHAEEGGARQDLSHLAAMVGRLPYSEGFESVWEDAGLKRAIYQSFGQKFGDTIYKTWAEDGWTVLTLRRSGSVLHTRLLRSHQGAAYAMLIYINLGAGPQDPQANSIQILFREQRAGKQHAYWLAVGQKPLEIAPTETLLDYRGPADPDGLQLLRKYDKLKWKLPSLK